MFLNSFSTRTLRFADLKEPNDTLRRFTKNPVRSMIDVSHAVKDSTTAKYKEDNYGCKKDRCLYRRPAP